MSVGKETDHITKLTNGADYMLWAKEIQLLFRKAGLLDIIDGTSKLDGIKVKDNDDAVTLKEAQEEWRARDAEATLIIYATIGPFIKRHILMCDTAHDMFSQLKTIYEKDNNQQKCNLLQAFHNFKFDENKDVMTNFTEIELIVYRLKALKEILSEDMQISRVFEALPPKYEYFSTIWDLTPLKDRTMLFLKSSLQHEEGKKGKPETSNVSNVCLNT